MSKKVTIEFKDAGLYKDLQQIARLVKEPPEELLQRAFKEWIQLREDLEDAEAVREAIEEYERTGETYTHDEIGKELAKRGLSQ